jgi:hypothetical protein
MSFHNLLTTMLHRWYALAAALLCAAVLTIFLAHDAGVFTTRTSIIFLYPNASRLDHYNGAGDRSIISFAATIAQEVNQGEPPITYAAGSAPYYGAGVRQGVLVGLPNSGSQWLAMYQKAQIDIQIVGPTSAWVEGRQTDLVNDVLGLADKQQAHLGIPAARRIVATVDPLTLGIDRVTPNHTAQLLAGCAMLGAGVLVGGWSAVMLDRLHHWRSGRTARTQTVFPTAGKVFLA